MYVIRYKISIISSLCQRTGFPKCPTFVLLPVAFLPTVILLSWTEKLEGWVIVYFLPAGLGLSIILWKFSLEKLFDLQTPKYDGIVL